MSELASSLSWAVMTAARRQGVVIDSVRLDTAIATAMGKNGSAAVDLQVLCTALSLPKAQQSAIPERAQLPMLGVVNERGWGIIVDQRPDGRWIFISEEGHALISDSDLIDGAYRLDFAALGTKDGQNGFERVFKEALAEFRPIILEVVIASVVMSIIALGASIFSMQVYDRVIPTHGVATLIVLAIGVSLAILFELGMKFARSHIMDTHNLLSGESADITSLLPTGMAVASFVSSLKGLYAEWGGLAITGDANTTDKHYTSVYSFPSGFGLDTSFSMVHQGGSYVKGENFKFTSPDGKRLLLNATDGFYASNIDVFAYKSPGASKDYDIGNVRLLYQLTTENPNSLPTVRVGYDGSKASAGDVIGLYEGDKLLGSRTLTAADVGTAGMTLDVTAASSLAAGQHVITTKFSDLAGNVVVGNDVRVTLAAGAVLPVLSNLRVNGETPDTQPINNSATKYAMITETPIGPVTLTGLDQNLTFSGNVGGAGTGDSYLISVSMGGKVIVFGEVKAGDFSLTTPANILAPGMYHDLTITATNTSAGINNGQTTIVQNQTLGWYWVPQKLDSLSGGAGDDQIQLAVTSGGANTVVQTGQGKDTLMLGGFGTNDSSRLVATISDFTLGQDKVNVFGQTVTKDNLNDFAKASAYNTSSTKLVVDLDGAGAGSTVYTLYLQNVAYNPGNTHTIFGV
ncbi:hypothetical protein [Herbaspirillum rubrisubalbicans]|uniref:hypothetical protein n=1 Tax=Herbaspirillum rubrisubalbicans TaxID=80842 RepID=UPI0020A6B8D9|nr:hypothetical protein [Herbaspirillum rubrisubalbicans]